MIIKITHEYCNTFCASPHSFLIYALFYITVQIGVPYNLPTTSYPYNFSSPLKIIPHHEHLSQYSSLLPLWSYPLLIELTHLPFLSSKLCKMSLTSPVYLHVVVISQPHIHNACHIIFNIPYLSNQHIYPVTNAVPAFKQTSMFSIFFSAWLLLLALVYSSLYSYLMVRSKQAISTTQLSGSNHL